MRDPRHNQHEEPKPDERIEVTDVAAAPQSIPVREGTQESHEHFRVLTEYARDAIVEIDREARFLYVSPSFTEFYGYRPEEVVGANALEFIHPEDRTEVEAIRSFAFSEETPAQFVFRFRHRDDSWRWVELGGRPYHDDGGELRAVLVCRDVTSRVRADRALQEQLEGEKRIADISRRFLSLEHGDFAACLRHGLEAAAGLAGAERVQFYAPDSSASGVGTYHQWNAPGVPVRDGHDLGAATETYRWTAAKLLAGEEIHVPRVADLPAEAAAERAGLERQGVLSYLGLPIAQDGGKAGFLGFFRMREERGWSAQEIARLALIADVLGSAVRRLHAEQQRRATEERFRTLTQQAQDAICELTPDGRVLFVSANIVNLCGYAPSEFEHVNPWLLIHPEDRVSLAKQVEAATSSDGDSAPLTYRIRHRDGAWRWLESTMSPFATPSGEARFAVVSRDVTERHERRLELERQLEIEKRVADFSRDLLETGEQGIDAGIQHGLEAAGTIAGADRAFLVSALGGDSARTSVCDWHAPGVVPRPYEPELEREKQAWILERLKAGRIIRLDRIEDLPDEAHQLREALVEAGIRSYLCIPIRSEGRLFGVLSFHREREQKSWSEREVTLLRVVADLFASALRRKRAETSLEESQQRLLQAQKMEAVGTLAGGIAHDFNNQLTVMLANARYVMRQIEGDEDLNRALEDLSRAAEHCAQLTRSLLAFARRTPDSPRSLAVDSVVAGVEELLRPLIPSSIDFEVDIRASQALVIADPTQLQQVLVNLVVNARDAMPEGGRLTLRAEIRPVDGAEAGRLGLAMPGPYVEFIVCDTGTGMDEPVRARVFEPFFTTKPVGEGTGLGLATAYGLVQQCGGAIGVESEPGCGSTFRVLLPQSLELAAGREGAPASRPPRGSGTVLLAEDEPGVRRLLARMLRAGGYEVLEAPNGADALRLGRQNVDQLAALVTDVDMPAIGGVELARRLARRWPELPVLFISGADPLAPGDVDAPAERSQFLAKPFTEHSLLEALHELLGGS
ncbi:MAG: PAS domain S-box protein [Deltaproteobacteria bacterium]|nr:PAS domain S-box protein [Deltaproteobacteria bacterium]